MKKYTLSTFIFLSFALAKAQISFLSTDMPALPWNNLQQKDTATGIGVNFGSRGANQVYDFSMFHFDVRDTTFYSAPTPTQLATVPNANLSATNDHISFLLGHTAATSFVWDGLQTTYNGTTILNNYTQVDTSYKFATNYGNTFSGTYGGSTVLPATVFTSLAGLLGWNNIKIVNSTVYTDTIDGWGKVKTPVGTYNCLRQHRREVSTTSIYYNTIFSSTYQLVPGTYLPQNPIIDTSNAFYYLAKETHGTVITFTYDSIHQPVSASWSLAPPLPVANFGITYGSNGLASFSDSSTGSPTTYSWSFGDGSPGSGTVNASHRYTRDSIYVVCLTVSNSSGSNTYCDTVYITNVSAPRAPKAVKDTASLIQPGAVTLDVIANDSNFNAPDSVCITAIWGAPAGWTAQQGCTDIVYQPLNLSYTGLDTFYYRSCDRVLPNLCDTGMVVIDVLPHPAPVSGFNLTQNGCLGATLVSHAQNADSLVWQFSQLSSAPFDTTIYASTLIAVPNSPTSFSNKSFSICLEAYFNPTGVVAQYCDTFTFGCAGISGPASEALKLYPNPVADALQLDLNGLEGIASVDIYDLLGNRMLSIAASSSLLRIPVAGFNNGIYFISANGNMQNRLFSGRFEVLK